MEQCCCSWGAVETNLRMNYFGEQGFPGGELVPLSSWTLDNGDPITTSGTNVKRASYATSGRCIAWTGTLTPATDIISLDIPVPVWFRESIAKTGQNSEILLYARCRMAGTGGSAIDDANLTTAIVTHSPAFNRRTGVETDGDSAFLTKTLTAKAVGARVTDATIAKFRTLEIPLLAELTAAQRATIKRRGTLRVVLGCSKALDANNTLQLASTHIVFSSHLTEPTAVERAKTLK